MLMTDKVRYDLTALFDALSEGTGVARSVLGKQFASDRSFLGDLSKGRSVNSGTYDRIVADMAAVWPADLPWPDGVFRPDVEASEPMERVEPPPAQPDDMTWPDGTPWPEDIPRPADPAAKDGVS